MSTFCTKIKTQDIHPEARTHRLPLSCCLLSTLLWVSGLMFSLPGAQLQDSGPRPSPRARDSRASGRMAGGKTQEQKWGLRMPLVPACSLLLEGRASTKDARLGLDQKLRANG